MLRTLSDLRGKTVLVLGLGKTGLAAVAFLAQHGATVRVWDDTPAAREAAAAAVPSLVWTDPSAQGWTGVDILLKSPGIPEQTPTVQAALTAGVHLIGDIDLLYLRDPQATYIGITGTNGKSTTTALIGHLLASAGHKVAVGGNIGQAALTLPVLGRGGFYVLELSSYQLLLVTSLRCQVALFLNLTPDHLERHGDMAGYRAAKDRIFDRQQPGDIKIIGVDTPDMAAYAASKPTHGLRRVALTEHPAEIRVTTDGVLMDGDQRITTLKGRANVPGTHNWQNVACAYAAVKDVITPAQFEAGLASFVGLPHRLQLVAEAAGVRFINDSKATNADAAIRALDSYTNIFWIAGGLPKSDGVTPCLAHLQSVKEVFLIGQAAEAFGRELSPHRPVTQCGVLEAAVRKAFAAAKASGLAAPVVLLAPACASWDQFKSFEHRGDEFARLSRALAEGREVA
jgi:UDP-N-acetylmuramoylalanine--D-glutamate ligase